MHLAGRLFRFRTPGQTFSRACRDLSFETPQGLWNQIEARPAPDLADAIECYWEGWGDIPPLKEKILPRTNIELMFNLQGRHSVLELDGKPLGSNHTGGWLSGLQRRHMLIETHEGSHFVAVRLRPWGAWRLLRQPMKDVSCRVPLLDDIWGDSIHELTARLHELPNPFARFDLLEDHFRRRLDSRARPDPGVIHAVERLHHSIGMQRIESLCRELGTSRATLSRRFNEQVGLTPKTYSRVVRISSLMARLGNRQPEDWAMLAAEFGYHDQAHLNHDFRDFCGTTPGEYLKRAAPGGGATIENPPT
ncbi:helix-turn-helix domain-containing protein [Elongatibacter sediminis]|uniref:Helix-turn-helix domain-containing protein n=1 Tax=Elongatibacter sediminis TaxID=3119006 RepID=A0AAW9RC63_9GAMM